MQDQSQLQPQAQHTFNSAIIQEVRCHETGKLLCKHGENGVYLWCDKHRRSHCIPWSVFGVSPVGGHALPVDVEQHETIVASFCHEVTMPVRYMPASSGILSVPDVELVFVPGRGISPVIRKHYEELSDEVFHQWLYHLYNHYLVEPHTLFMNEQGRRDVRALMAKSYHRLSPTATMSEWPSYVNPVTGKPMEIVLLKTLPEKTLLLG